MEVLSKRYRRTSADVLKLVEPTDIKMYLIFRIKSSPSSKRKQGIRQPTVYAHYKTFQMVYCLDTRRRWAGGGGRKVLTGELAQAFP